MDDKRLAEIREACEDGDTLANLTEVYDMLGDVLVELDALRPDAKLGAAVLAMADKSREGCHDTSLSVSTTVDPVNDPLAEEWIVTNDFLCWGEGDTALMAFTDAGLMEAIGG